MPVQIPTLSEHPSVKEMDAWLNEIVSLCRRSNIDTASAGLIHENLVKRISTLDQINPSRKAFSPSMHSTLEVLSILAPIIPDAIITYFMNTSRLTSIHDIHVSDALLLLHDPGYDSTSIKLYLDTIAYLSTVVPVLVMIHLNHKISWKRLSIIRCILDKDNATQSWLCELVDGILVHPAYHAPELTLECVQVTAEKQHYFPTAIPELLQAYFEPTDSTLNTAARERQTQFKNDIKHYIQTCATQAKCPEAQIVMALIDEDNRPQWIAAFNSIWRLPEAKAIKQALSTGTAFEPPKDNRQAAVNRLIKQHGAQIQAILSKPQVTLTCKGTLHGHSINADPHNHSLLGFKK